MYFVFMFQVYYPVRHNLIQHMVSSTQRLGFSASATIEYRKLAVELAEVIIKWELQRIKDESETIEIKIVSKLRYNCFDYSLNTNSLTPVSAYLPFNYFSNKTRRRMKILISKSKIQNLLESLLVEI